MKAASASCSSAGAWRSSKPFARSNNRASSGGAILASTGTTLRENGLVETSRILDISARLIVNRAALKTDSRVGALDRTLGFVFGAARGILLVVVAMLFFNWLVAAPQQPDWVAD